MGIDNDILSSNKINNNITWTTLDFYVYFFILESYPKQAKCLLNYYDKFIKDYRRIKPKSSPRALYRDINLEQVQLHPTIVFQIRMIMEPSLWSDRAAIQIQMKIEAIRWSEYNQLSIENENNQSCVTIIHNCMMNIFDFVNGFISTNLSDEVGWTNPVGNIIFD